MKILGINQYIAEKKTSGMSFEQFVKEKKSCVEKLAESDANEFDSKQLNKMTDENLYELYKEMLSTTNESKKVKEDEKEVTIVVNNDDDDEEESDDDADKDEDEEDADEAKKKAVKEAKSAMVYTIQSNIGKVKHAVSFHDGEKTYSDGSPFFDIKTFVNKADMAKFVDDLKKKGYTEE